MPIVVQKSDTTSQFLLYVKILAWAFLIFDLFFYDHSSSGQDPSGMGRGLHGLYITLPLFLFIFVVNLVLIFKKSQRQKYKVIGVVSFIFLSVMFLSVI